MMIPELKQQWIETLESGEYSQNQGSLRNCEPDGTNTYCCLGVLCLLTGMGIWDESFYYAFDSDSSSRMFVPDSIGEKIRLPRNIQHELTRMNDIGYSFKEIANYLREHPEI